MEFGTFYELMTACYDPQQNKILSCRENTIIYLHELGHKKQYESGKLQITQNYIWYFVLASIAFLAVENNIWASYTLLIALLLLMGLELDAWLFVIHSTNIVPEVKNGKL